MNILIADCGSTKCDWALVDSLNKTVISRFQTKGINLALAEREAIIAFAESLPAFPKVDTIEYYGAGVGINPKNDDALSAAIGYKYGAPVTLATDLLGAGRALFGNYAGVACILGTGSNTGFYDGETIAANTPPLGFILGDEGSGAALGKRLINAVFKGHISSELRDLFFENYPITKQELIENVYRKPGANFYLAQFAKFLSDNIHEPELVWLVEEEFREFFYRNLTAYIGNQDFERDDEIGLGFVGSVAYHFAPQLREVAWEKSPVAPPVEIKVLQSPIDGLIKNILSNA